MKIAMATQAHRWLIAFVLLSIGLTVLMLNHEPAALIARVQMIVGDSPQAAWLLFAVLTLISQLLIVPSGSLLLMAGGFLLGAMPAALIYALIQVLTTWPVIWLGRNGGMERAERHLETLSPMLSRMAQALREAPFSLALVLTADTGHSIGGCLPAVGGFQRSAVRVPVGDDARVLGAPGVLRKHRCRGARIESPGQTCRCAGCRHPVAFAAGICRRGCLADEPALGQLPTATRACKAARVRR